MSEGKLNILFIAKWFPHPGDAQFGVFTLKHAQAASLFNNIYVLHLCPLEIDEVNLIKNDIDGLTILRLEYPSSWNVLQKSTRLTSLLKKATSQVKTEFGAPDVVHCHILGSPVLIARFYFPKTPFIVSEHWTGYINGYFTKMPNWKQRWFKSSTEKAALTTVPSENLKRVMIDTHRFQGKFEVLANVIELPENLSLSSPPIHVKALVVADLHEHNKNITGLLKAWDSIKLPADSELIIAGDGQDKQMLQDLSEAMHLDKKGVAFCGRLHNEEVFEAMTSSSFLVVNSNFETFSMVTAEALAAGIPVLATRCGGPEQFVDKTNGVLIDKNDPQKLQEALLHMIEHSNSFDREQISREFRHKFSAEKVGERMTDFYKQALNL